MLKLSGKPVHLTRITRRKNSAQLSTWLMENSSLVVSRSAKAQLVPQLIPIFPQLFSPAKVAYSPLFEHYFYPVSTVPTIRSTKENFKER